MHIESIYFINRSLWPNYYPLFILVQNSKLWPSILSLGLFSSLSSTQLFAYDAVYTDRRGKWAYICCLNDIYYNYCSLKFTDIKIILFLKTKTIFSIYNHTKPVLTVTFDHYMTKRRSLFNNLLKLNQLFKFLSIKYIKFMSQSVWLTCIPIW